MNERIRKLAEQAFFETEYDDVQNLPETMERFAELIVRESIVDFYRHYLDLSGGDDITEQVDRYVKDNFGVEE